MPNESVSSAENVPELPVPFNVSRTMEQNERDYIARRQEEYDQARRTYYSYVTGNFPPDIPNLTSTESTISPIAEEFFNIPPSPAPRPSALDAVECRECETPIARTGGFRVTGDNIARREYVCESCRDDIGYLNCSSCGFVHHPDTSRSPDDSDQQYCSMSCANSAGWYHCADCQEWCSNEYVDNDGGYICDSCSESYRDCDDCGDTFHVDNLEYSTHSDGHYCRSCRRNNTNRLIHDYSYKPREYLFSKMPWENTVYMGVELEVECESGDQNEKAEKVMSWLKAKSLDKYLYLKIDGSLENGFEIVFHPMTLQYMHKKFPMKGFLDYLRRAGLSSHTSGTCGLHVHISKKRMSELSILRGKVFFWKCHRQILKMSRREGDLGYCKFDQNMPREPYRQENGRYSAFNTCASESTVEIRIFRGTLEYNSFLASLQFSDAFAEFIQSASIVFIRTNEPEIVWQSFVDYLKKSRRYAQLSKYIKTRRIK